MERLNTDQIPNFLSDCGIDKFVRANLGQTRAGKKRVELLGEDKTIFLNEGEELGQVERGDLGLLFRLLAKACERADVKKDDFSATDLLGRERFAQACLDRICTNGLPRPFTANSFLQELVDFKPTSLPVFYGSTAGINFAEVLETAQCASEAIKRGVDSSVVFDFDGRPSVESTRIFKLSLEILPESLKERVVNFREQFGERFINARLEATREMVSRIPGLPKIAFIDGQEVFLGLGERFKLGQLLLLAKIAGQNPTLFSRKSIFSEEVKVKLDDFLRTEAQIARKIDPKIKLSNSIGSLMELGFKNAGFTYYARDAVIGLQDGILGVPLKLTDKANIYGILDESRAIFNPDTNKGTVLFPITRQRIESVKFSKPIDPVILMVLAQDQPEGFERLVKEFLGTSRVLTVEEAIDFGTRTNTFLIEDFFDLKREKYE